MLQYNNFKIFKSQNNLNFFNNFTNCLFELKELCCFVNSQLEKSIGIKNTFLPVLTEAINSVSAPAIKENILRRERVMTLSLFSVCLNIKSYQVLIKVYLEIVSTTRSLIANFDFDFDFCHMTLS